jgi:hypothetical protein
MNHLKFIATLLPVLACGYPSLTAADPAPVGAQASPAKPEITGCVVYSESDRSKKRDCLAQARASCAAQAATCELPIGLGLTNNEQIDGDAKSWKKVLVEYRCNQAQLVNGPHTQDDHATMIIGCMVRL